MQFPVKKFFSYYKPYLRLYLAVLGCALIASAITLVYPLLVRYTTKDVLTGNLSNALPEVYWIGGLMLVLVLIENLRNAFVGYKGHLVGARMESDLRRELFEHIQKLSFDDQEAMKAFHGMHNTNWVDVIQANMDDNKFVHP
jgi:ATP-binding cassette subfamily B protein